MLKRKFQNNQYNLYNLVAKRPQYKYKVGNDLTSLKRNFHVYQPQITKASYTMFWVSAAVIISFVISQIVLVLNH